eukprot:3825523-Amphidinium_carterae.2
MMMMMMMMMLMMTMMMMTMLMMTFCLRGMWDLSLEWFEHHQQRCSVYLGAMPAKTFHQRA